MSHASVRDIIFISSVWPSVTEVCSAHISFYVDVRQNCACLLIAIWRFAYHYKILNWQFLSFIYVKNNFNLTCDSKSYSISSFLYIIFAIINKTPLTFNWIGDVMDKRKYPYYQSDSASVIIRRIMIVILLYIGTTERWPHILTEKQQIQSIQKK